MGEPMTNLLQMWPLAYLAPLYAGRNLPPPPPVGHYVRVRLGIPEEGFLQKWPPGRGSGPPYPIICT